MFKKFDLVIPSGYRAEPHRGKSERSHRFGTNSRMLEWEREARVLAVEEVDEFERRALVRPACQRRGEDLEALRTSYDLSELRLPSEAELKAHEAEILIWHTKKAEIASAENLIPLQQGDVLLMSRGPLGIVIEGPVMTDDQPKARIRYLNSSSTWDRLYSVEGSWLTSPNPTQHPIRVEKVLYNIDDKGTITLRGGERIVQF